MNPNCNFCFRYSIHLYDIQHTELWERKATLVYHVDLVMELLSLMVNFVHHLHMLFSGNIWLSMASLVICMQVSNNYNMTFLMCWKSTDCCFYVIVCKLKM